MKMDAAIPSLPVSLVRLGRYLGSREPFNSTINGECNFTIQKSCFFVSGALSRTPVITSQNENLESVAETILNESKYTSIRQSIET